MLEYANAIMDQLNEWHRPKKGVDICEEKKKNHILSKRGSDADAGVCLETTRQYGLIPKEQREIANERIALIIFDENKAGHDNAEWGSRTVLVVFIL